LQKSASALIERVRKDNNSRNAVIRELYNDIKLNNFIYSFVLKNGGTKDQGHDLLSNSIIAFIQQCYRTGFEVKHEIHTYIFSIARYNWINDKKSKSNLNTVELEERDEEFTSSIEEAIIGEERIGLLKRALTQLDEKCREVMTMWASQIKMREIAIRMSYASEQVARKKKHQCLNKLKVLLKAV